MSDFIVMIFQMLLTDDHEQSLGVGEYHHPPLLSQRAGREIACIIQVATLEKTQLIAKDFSELRIHFWPDVWPFMVGL
ncbi:predicted protein [Histoplasma mississippiense (nom. inval.)]|uniref:predicted protein n=1 Tax=Ajellomyces capsulatus (strain NAm1 / WU24) TaxID=2059318 RepID=UPI000157D5AC|nr:predicted protein [Histoplasma mississippiense (nom. inval.)]EDN05448.1 predicted protein [Histoplasma mississippiense (nom. inval.)]